MYGSTAAKRLANGTAGRHLFERTDKYPSRKNSTLMDLSTLQSEKLLSLTRVHARRNVTSDTICLAPPVISRQ
jgi:hypothetical protein